MCRQGLFYFSNPTSYGPPRETCLHHMKRVLASDAKPFATWSILTGVACLMMFLSHVGLYYRPVESSDRASSYRVDGPGASAIPIDQTANTTSMGRGYDNQIEISQITAERVGAGGRPSISFGAPDPAYASELSKKRNANADPVENDEEEKQAD